MTKKNIVRRIADGLDRTELETKLIVQKTLDAIINVLAEEGRVELRAPRQELTRPRERPYNRVCVSDFRRLA